MGAMPGEVESVISELPMVENVKVIGLSEGTAEAQHEQMTRDPKKYQKNNRDR